MKGEAEEPSSSASFRTRNITMKTRINKTHPSHPILVEITLNVERFYHFGCLVDDSVELRMIGNDDPDDGMITVYVACIDHDVARAMEDGWS
jgi:HD superfamily phosphohydrolase YqeK